MERIKLEGKRFGRLSVLERDGVIGKATAYLCLCDCGEKKRVRGQSLRNGDTTSCGCARRDKMAAMHASHGMYKTPTYNSWRAMIARCLDKKHRQYKDYGGRGITFCKDWASFKCFFRDMGERPEGKTLDRSDPDGNYEKTNCRWATRQEQNLNKRKARG
jgi:hypothetical protein